MIILITILISIRKSNNNNTIANNSKGFRVTFGKTPSLAGIVLDAVLHRSGKPSNVRSLPARVDAASALRYATRTNTWDNTGLYRAIRVILGQYRVIWG